MYIANYTEEYYLDIVEIVTNFHTEAVGEYDDLFDAESVIETITRLKDDNAQNAFLLVIDGKCQGLLAGVEIYSMFNKKRIFQEYIWYVNKEYRRYGVWLLNKVETILKCRGIDTLIMAVLENSKTEKLKKLYDSMGFRKFEVHYIKGLS